MTQLSTKDIDELTSLARKLMQKLADCNVIDVAASKPLPKHKKKKGPHLQEWEARQVLEYYRTVHPRKAKGIARGHKSFTLILNRLGEGFTVEELKKAVDGNKRCEWHSSKAGAHGLQFVFRNSEKVERFLEESKEQKNKIGHHMGSEEFADGEHRDFD